MVELKVKVGEKGQILIPKVFRDRYGIVEGEKVSIELTSEGILIRGKPSQEEIMKRLKEHVEKIRRIGVSGLKLGGLSKAYLEMEFEENAG
ncbi:MAG: AbrB/MazE/SpoVT family DNA-binding domain-containing protein [Thaumarchaeota archaeon]|jgi:AbrB family looped-hinge helix DNA binding protein|nr:AbrB/MazE/SpoVT family DNA-binding domain-containing protein [Nitrososphaerota archaeon]